jgi:hypothetical protein
VVVGALLCPSPENEVSSQVFMEDWPDKPLSSLWG